MNRQILEKLVREYSKVLVWDLTDSDVRKMYFSFIEIMQRGICSQKMVILAHGFEEDEEYGGQTLLRLSDEEYEGFLKYYYMYEFSCKVQLVAKSDQYASLFNYLKTEIITINEFVTALIC